MSNTQDSIEACKSEIARLRQRLGQIYLEVGWLNDEEARVTESLDHLEEVLKNLEAET